MRMRLRRRSGITSPWERELRQQSCRLARQSRTQLRVVVSLDAMFLSRFFVSSMLTDRMLRTGAVPLPKSIAIRAAAAAATCLVPFRRSFSVLSVRSLRTSHCSHVNQATLEFFFVLCC